MQAHTHREKARERKGKRDYPSKSEWKGVERLLLCNNMSSSSISLILLCDYIGGFASSILHSLTPLRESGYNIPLCGGSEYGGGVGSDRANLV